MKIFQKVPFARFFVNTIVQVIGRLGIILFVVPMAGYALARKQFPGRDLVFIGILSLMMIPREATLVPLFVIAKKFPLLGGNNILGEGVSMLDGYRPDLAPCHISILHLHDETVFLDSTRESRRGSEIDGASGMADLLENRFARGQTRTDSFGNLCFSRCLE